MMTGIRKLAEMELSTAAVAALPDRERSALLMASRIMLEDNQAMRDSLAEQTKLLRGILDVAKQTRDLIRDTAKPGPFMDEGATVKPDPFMGPNLTPRPEPFPSRFVDYGQQTTGGVGTRDAGNWSFNSFG